jgi:hypothetical protein
MMREMTINPTEIDVNFARRFKKLRLGKSFRDDVQTVLPTIGSSMLGRCSRFNHFGTLLHTLFWDISI